MNQKKNMNCTDAFPHVLKKKINKTSEARGGNGIYKRRNSRTYRVIIHLTTYKKLMESNPAFLDKFKRGYAVRIKPSEYFAENGDAATDFPVTLDLGRNAFVYFKSIREWNKYNQYCKTTSGEDWEEIVELYTKSEKVPNDAQWIGQYCLFINNTQPKNVSHICGSNNSSEYIKSLKIKYNLQKIPVQTGLGNYDFDYASDDEMKKIKYQLSYMIYNVPGMKECLISVLNSTSNGDLNADIQRSKKSGTLSQYIDSVIKHIEEYCQQNKLLDFDILSNVRAWNKESHEPVCPLCLKSLVAKQFFETATQDEGREEEDNTQAKIVLMHIDGLKPGELNHRTYNLGWGHKHCNTIQGPYDIEYTLDFLKEIVAEYRS